MKITDISNDHNFGSRTEIHELILKYFSDQIDPDSAEVNIKEQVNKPATALAESEPARLTRIGKEQCAVVPGSEFVLVYRHRSWTSYAALRSPKDKIDIYWPCRTLDALAADKSDNLETEVAALDATLAARDPAKDSY